MLRWFADKMFVFSGDIMNTHIYTLPPHAGKREDAGHVSVPSPPYRAIPPNLTINDRAAGRSTL